jgi:hypothetical protein
LLSVQAQSYLLPTQCASILVLYRLTN